MKLKNLLFQPITLNVSFDNEGLHLNAREVTDILESRISDEIRKAEVSGIVSLIGTVDEGISSVLGSNKRPTSNDSALPAIIDISTDSQKKASAK